MSWSDMFDDTTSGAGTGAMAGPYGAAAGAGLGLGKYFLLDRPRQQRMNQLAAVQTSLSGLPGGKRGEISQGPDPFSNALAFGSTGANIGQSVTNNQNQGKLQDAYIKALGAPRMNYGTAPSTPTSGSPWNLYGQPDLMTPDQMFSSFGGR